VSLNPTEVVFMNLVNSVLSQGNAEQCINSV